MRTLACNALIIGLISLLCLVPAKADAGYIVSVDAGPSCIPADGKSYSQILVTVLDQTGAPVPDGTQARLTTSAGDITPTVYTSGGRATGILTSSACPQIATIDANIAGASGSVQVEFSSSDKTATSARAIRIAGGSLAYSVEQDTVVGSDSVVIECKNLTIHATSAQVCQMLGMVRAQGGVTVQCGDQTINADALTYDLRANRLRALDSEDQPSVRTFDAGNLRLISTQVAQADDQNFAPLGNTDGKTWIVSRRLVIFPGEKILFFKASVYVGDSKVIKMPYYTYSYEKRESILQQVRYSSSDGMLVDLPFYYQMADSSTGALKLRYAAKGDDFGGYFRPRKGLSIGVEQAYSMNDRSQGRLFIDGMGSSSQTYELAHHVEYGSAQTSGRADISARYQPSSSFAKGVYNTTLNVNGGLGNYDYSVFGYLGGSRIQQPNYLNTEATDYVSQSDCSIRTIIRPRIPIMAKGFGRISPSLTVGYGSLGVTSQGRASSCLYQSLGIGYSLSRPGNRRTALGFEAASAFTTTADGANGVSLRAGPTLRSRWRGGSMSLNYTLNLKSGSTDTVSVLSKHLLGGNLSLINGGKWNSTAFFNYGLDSGRLSLYSQTNMRIANKWQMKTNYNICRYTNRFNGRSYSFETSYLKAGVYHSLGPFQVGVAWSPDGQEYGINKTKRLWLEFGSSGF